MRPEHSLVSAFTLLSLANPGSTPGDDQRLSDVAFVCADFGNSVTAPISDLSSAADALIQYEETGYGTSIIVPGTDAATVDRLYRLPRDDGKAEQDEQAHHD